ncbi:hypothetical protein C8J23_15620 [Shewanella chilikensis]|uniref:Uncharacterized protein n=1 Tax=Shewanella chilikensis TaxID=558541 RepID=A0ABX5PHP8_9GAMM|nr:hypothetical protein C8J23_15620 [Shewanella chilikensis]
MDKNSILNEIKLIEKNTVLNCQVSIKNFCLKR